MLTYILRWNIGQPGIVSCLQRLLHLHTYVAIYYCDAGVPSGVMNVRIKDDITSESFVVLWDEVMDFFTITYNVTWYNDSGIIGMDTVNSPPYTVTGLSANRSYNVTVVAINTCCGAGPVSTPVEVMINMREPTLPPLSSLTTPILFPTPTTGNVTYVLIFSAIIIKYLNYP